MQLEVRRRADNAILPKKANPWDAGFDIYVNSSARIPRGWVTPVGTGLSVAIPKGHVGLLTIRSSLGKVGLQLANAPGVIDAGYRGELILLLTNSNPEPYDVKIGDKVAQLVIVPIPEMSAVEVDELSESDGRGTGGFGSSGS